MSMNDGVRNSDFDEEKGEVVKIHHLHTSAFYKSTIKDALRVLKGVLTENVDIVRSEKVNVVLHAVQQLRVVSGVDQSRRNIGKMLYDMNVHHCIRELLNYHIYRYSGPKHKIRCTGKLRKILVQLLHCLANLMYMDSTIIVRYLRGFDGICGILIKYHDDFEMTEKCWYCLYNIFGEENVSIQAYDKLFRFFRCIYKHDLNKEEYKKAKILSVNYEKERFSWALEHCTEQVSVTKEVQNLGIFHAPKLRVFRWMRIKNPTGILVNSVQEARIDQYKEIQINRKKLKCIDNSYIIGLFCNVAKSSAKVTVQIPSDVLDIMFEISISILKNHQYSDESAVTDFFYMIYYITHSRDTNVKVYMNYLEKRQPDVLKTIFKKQYLNMLNFPVQAHPCVKRLQQYEIIGNFCGSKFGIEIIKRFNFPETLQILLYGLRPSEVVDDIYISRHQVATRAIMNLLCLDPIFDPDFWDTPTEKLTKAKARIDFEKWKIKLVNNTIMDFIKASLVDTSWFFDGPRGWGCLVTRIEIISLISECLDAENFGIFFTEDNCRQFIKSVHAISSLRKSEEGVYVDIFEVIEQAYIHATHPFYGEQIFPCFEFLHRGLTNSCIDQMNCATMLMETLAKTHAGLELTSTPEVEGTRRLRRKLKEQMYSQYIELKKRYMKGDDDLQL